MAKKPTLHRKKFREMILYFAEIGRDDRPFGLTRLNKQMWAADFWAYRALGAPISGATYLHREFGPSPKGIEGERASLVEDGGLSIKEEQRLGGTLKRPVALRGADASVFSQDEIQVMDEVAAVFKGKWAAAVTEWSHSLPAWLLTLDCEEIPYHMAFMWQDEKVGLEDFAWAYTKLAERQGEQQAGRKVS
jgi:hypothetical protein